MNTANLLKEERTQFREIVASITTPAGVGTSVYLKGLNPADKGIVVALLATAVASDSALTIFPSVIGNLGVSTSVKRALERVVDAARVKAKESSIIDPKSDMVMFVAIGFFSGAAVGWLLYMNRGS